MPTKELEPAELEYEAPPTLVVTEPEQLRALGDELRGTIVSLLRERAWSTQQLARELDIPKGTVGHHLKVLERAGLIHVVHTRRVRAVTEKFYGRTARLFLFQPEDPADSRALGAATLRDAAFQLERAPEGAGWGLMVSRLDAKAIARFDRRLEKLIADFVAADARGGVPHRLVLGFWKGRTPDA